MAGRRGRSEAAAEVLMARRSEAAALSSGSGAVRRGSSALEWVWRGAATATAQSKGREKRERKREGKQSAQTMILTTIFLTIFHSNLKIFQYESCSKFQILQLSFQAHFHLKLRLKVKI